MTSRDMSLTKNIIYCLLCLYSVSLIKGQSAGQGGRIVYPAPRLVFLNPQSGGQPLPNTALGSSPQQVANPYSLYGNRNPYANVQRPTAPKLHLNQLRTQSPSTTPVVNPNMPMGAQTNPNRPTIRVIHPGQNKNQLPSAPRVRVIRPGSKVTSDQQNLNNRPTPRIIRPRIQPRPRPQVKPQPTRQPIVIRRPESSNENQVVIRPPPIRNSRDQRPNQRPSPGSNISTNDRRQPAPVIIRPVKIQQQQDEKPVRQPRPVIVRPIDVQRQPQERNGQNALVSVINSGRQSNINSRNRNIIQPQPAQSNSSVDGRLFMSTDQRGQSVQSRQRQHTYAASNYNTMWRGGKGWTSGGSSREMEMKAYPENYCDDHKYSDEQLSAYNMKRVEHYVANLSCSTYFFECAVGQTFLKNCTTNRQAFDVNLMNCNYKYNIRTCPEYDHVMHCTIREECTAEEFACCNAPQKCIPYAQRCDGIPDCSDGEDEVNCPSCAADEFPCTKSDRCIPYSKRCDGTPDDCRDESNLDEYNCGQCSSEQFQCTRSQGNYGTPCIDLDQRCNGVTDCPNGEDELNCKSKGPKYLLCENQKQSVTKAQWCDNVEDCLDGSDELYCFYKR